VEKEQRERQKRGGGGFADRKESGGGKTWSFALPKSSAQLAAFFSRASNCIRREIQDS